MGGWMEDARDTVTEPTQDAGIPRDGGGDSRLGRRGAASLIGHGFDSDMGYFLSRLGDRQIYVGAVGTPANMNTEFTPSPSHAKTGGGQASSPLLSSTEPLLRMRLENKA